MNMYTNEAFFDTLLCWVRPTRDFLSFLHAELRRLYVTKIVSVGCGCGFLEWLIKRACSGIEVIGYEVDRAWWQGRYGVKPFIEHIYIDEVKTRHVPAGSVLMTCYFHSWECWNQYLAEFRGDIVIVIGPDTNDHVTFPEPRHLLSDPRFVLESQRDIAGGDKIVIMRRNPELWPVPPPPPEPAADEPPLPSVKPPDSKAEQAKRYNEMRRSLVMNRICNAKQNPKTAPVDPKVRQGPALRSTYTTRKPSLAFSLGSTSVASRLKNLDGGAAGGIRRSASCSAHLDSLGKSREDKSVSRRKTTAPAGSGSRAGSSGASPRLSGSVTPDGRDRRSAVGQRLGVATAFAGRPLRESRSVPSLATLQELDRNELETKVNGNADFGSERTTDTLDSSVRRRRPTNEDDDRQPTETPRRRRREAQGPASTGSAEDDGDSQQTATERRRRTRAAGQPDSSERQPHAADTAATDGASNGQGENQMASGQEQGVKVSPPLVTVTDLSGERRQSLRRPSWSLFSLTSPSR
ncbi:translation initiation factor IF-2-like isoform X2 [Amphibalanus amphitrite]|nr:translation initiation factor IF-2-like isoform X2 [Amphibalanus amphitrite]